MYQNLDELSDSMSNMFVIGSSEIGRLGGINSCNQSDSINQSCQNYIEEESQSIKISSKDPEEYFSFSSVGEAQKGKKFLDIVL
jgi:hypothetical protein